MGNIDEGRNTGIDKREEDTYEGRSENRNIRERERGGGEREKE